MSTVTFTVVGMTCDHCVSSVTQEVSALPGVSDVVVDLASGLLAVTSSGTVDAVGVASAVAEAGYQLAGT